MKISKERLTQLVQEELAISFGGVAPATGGMLPAENPKPDTDGEGYMAKQNLWKIAEYAQEMYELVDDSDCLEPWVEEKLAVAAYIMDSVGHYIEYMKHRAHETAEGDVDTLEAGEAPEAPFEEEPMEDEEYEFEMPEDEEGEDEPLEMEPEEGEESEEDYEEEEEV